MRGTREWCCLIERARPSGMTTGHSRPFAFWQVRSEISSSSPAISGAGRRKIADELGHPVAQRRAGDFRPQRIEPQPGKGAGGAADCLEAGGQARGVENAIHVLAKAQRAGGRCGVEFAQQGEGGGEARGESACRTRM